MLKKIVNCAFVGAVTLSLCLAFAFAPTPAQAAAIDLSPILAPVLDIVFPVFGVVLIYLAKRTLNAFEDRTNIQLDNQLKERLNEALMNGVMFGKSKIKEKYSSRSLTIDTQNEIVGHAVNYAAKAVPGAIEYFGLTTGRIIELAEARLQQDLNGDGRIGAVKSYSDLNNQTR
ncbi:hypothetical protein ACQU0X_24195 [Pseudovibrio ascidiaceicola]|uniref:hypothetical protein n=1 Tax=Pseudovibrio ascidiaceicola TaxID=285279 RepID=UPI003D36DDAD